MKKLLLLISVLAIAGSAAATIAATAVPAGTTSAKRATLKLRSVPELHFRYDDSVDRGERIDALLKGP